MGRALAAIAVPVAEAPHGRRFRSYRDCAEAARVSLTPSLDMEFCAGAKWLVHEQSTSRAHCVALSMESPDRCVVWNASKKYVLSWEGVQGMLGSSIDREKRIFSW
eukprot:11212517-Lingulodinium_polyedra.AAC.1